MTHTYGYAGDEQVTTYTPACYTDTVCIHTYVRTYCSHVRTYVCHLKYIRMCTHLYATTFYIRIVLCCSNGALSAAQASMSMMCPCLARFSTTSHLEVSALSLPPSTPSAPEENLTRCGHINRVCSVCNIHT